MSEFRTRVVSRELVFMTFAIFAWRGAQDAIAATNGYSAAVYWAGATVWAAIAVGLVVEGVFQQDDDE